MTCNNNNIIEAYEVCELIMNEVPEQTIDWDTYTVFTNLIENEGVPNNWGNLAVTVEQNSSVYESDCDDSHYEYVEQNEFDDESCESEIQEQSEIKNEVEFDFKNITSNVVCESDAGCGKTFFLSKVSENNNNLLYLVFNKKNQTEAENMDEFKKNKVLTFHKFVIDYLKSKGYRQDFGNTRDLLIKQSDDFKYLANKAREYVTKFNVTKKITLADV